jgi:hypothetical protein
MGLVIGLVVGAGGMYLALKTPWASHGTPPAASGQVAEAPSDAGVGTKGKKKKRGRRPGGGGGGGNQPGGDDEDWANSGGGEETEAPRLVQLSAADRTMEWRGDDTSPPKQTLDMNSGGESRSLDNGEIQSVIGSSSGPVQQCVIEAATNTDLSGTITVKMVVEGTGKVSRSRVHAPRYLHNQGVLSCIQRSLRSWKFPATGSPTLVTLPVNFH